MKDLSSDGGRHAIDPAKKTLNVATKALEVVHGDRNKQYGHPKDNHSVTAQMFSAYLTKRFGQPIHLTMRDVCMLNMLQKVARDAHSAKEDNLVDVIGWALNAEIVSE